MYISFFMIYNYIVVRTTVSDLEVCFCLTSELSRESNHKNDERGERWIPLTQWPEFLCAIFCQNTYYCIYSNIFYTVCTTVRKCRHILNIILKWCRTVGGIFNVSYEKGLSTYHIGPIGRRTGCLLTLGAM